MSGVISQSCGPATVTATGVERIPKFTGTIRYVATDGNDANTGLSPDVSKATILATIAASVAGDAITVKAGTYDEDGLDLNLAGLELWCEAGTILVNSTPGTVLTASALAYVVRGAHFVQAGGVGLHATGIGGIVDQCIAVNCTTGFDIDEHSTQLFGCVSAAHTVTGFDIGERNTVLRQCFARGTGAATRGFYLSAAVTNGCLLDQCHSVGNATRGFELVAGAQYNDITFSSSGGGDGRRVNAGDDNVFANFSPNEHAVLFGGTVWYVDGTNGANTNDGLTPATPKATITAAEALMAAGDAINVRAGTYTESVTVNNAASELWGEIGAVMVGTLTVSADSCRVRGMIVAPVAAIGLALTGNRCKIEDVQIAGTPTIAFDIDGYQNVLYDVKAVGYTVTAYDVANYSTHIKDSIAQGDGGARRGYYLSNTATDDCTLENCMSIGNTTAGFEIVTGANYNTIKDSASGGGDGATVDNGSFNNWPGYIDQLDTEHHEDIYPISNGQGTAGDPVAIDNATVGGSAQNFWGDIVRVIPPNILTARWKSIGIYIHGTTASDTQQWEILFTYASNVSAQNGGNDWDAAETVLTVADGSLFEDEDVVWITGNDRVEGEIMLVSGAPAGNVVTLARETTNDAGTGLRYNYDATGVGNMMYLVKRDGAPLYEGYEGDFSAASARAHERYQWHEPKQIAPNGGMLMRMLNATDAGDSEFDVRAIYED